MSQMIDRLIPDDDLVAIAERASLYQLLQQALRRQRVPQALPFRLYADMGLSAPEVRTCLSDRR